MTPAVFGNVEGQLSIWALAMIRPGAAMLAAPVFGATSVPVQVRVILSLAVGIPAAALSGMVVPHDGVLSVSGLLIVVGEAVLGLALGFAVQIGLAAALVAGEVISNAMGLGFASMSDPLSGHSSTAIGQFLSLLATALFLCMGGHLALIEIVVHSFQSLPPGASWLNAHALRGLVDFGGLMFAAGMVVALPVAFMLVLVQIVMGVIGRSAPALNLFAVGIPATVLAGLVLLAVATPLLASGIEHAMSLAIGEAQLLSTGH